METFHVKLLYFLIVIEEHDRYTCACQEHKPYTIYTASLKKKLKIFYNLLIKVPYIQVNGDFKEHQIELTSSAVKLSPIFCSKSLMLELIKVLLKTHVENIQTNSIALFNAKRTLHNTK